MDFSGSRFLALAFARASTGRLTWNSPSVMRPALIFWLTQERVLGAMIGGHNFRSKSDERSRIRPDSRMPGDSPPPVIAPRTRTPELPDMTTRSSMSRRASSIAALPMKSMRSTATGVWFEPCASMATLRAWSEIFRAVKRPSASRTGSTLPRTWAREFPTSRLESVTIKLPVTGS